MNPFSRTGCYVCLDCPNHLTNAKFGYVIPCKEKANCTKYQEDLQAQRDANAASRRENALRYTPNFSNRRRR